MKITPEDFITLRNLVATHDTLEARSEAIALGWTYGRYIWWVTGRRDVLAFICDTLYKYLDDTHIDTALRRIAPPLETK